MAFQPATTAALVELIYLSAGQRCQNNLTFSHATTGWTAPELTALAQAVQNWWVGEMAALTANSVSLIQIDATDLSDQFGPKITLPVTPPQFGTVGSELEPNNATFCTTFVTGFRGRAFRGRNFLVGLAAQWVTESTVLNAFATSLRNAYSELLGATYLPAGVDWVLVTRVVNGVVQMPTALKSPITGAVHADLTVDSQRRRLPGRGK